MESITICHCSRLPFQNIAALKAWQHSLLTVSLTSLAFADWGSGGHQENQAWQGKGGGIPILIMHVPQQQHEHQPKGE